MEKGNVVPVHKMGDKQSLKNYRPISLLHICGKIFERLIYNKRFEYFIEKDLIFISEDSCINQLLSITHEIYESFDQSYKTRGVFLDISKAFDKIWRKGLLHKLKEKGISGKLLNIVTDFLYQRKQAVVLNCQYSS